MSIKITIRKQGMRYKTNPYKEVSLLESKLSENIGKPKELWKSLKSLGLTFECSVSNINYLENE